MNGKVSEIEEAASGMEVPEIIRVAGERTVHAYLEFLEDATLRTSTRRVYGGHIRRFFRWAETRGLAIETMNAGDWPAYVASHSTSADGIGLSSLRSLFRHLVAAGVLAENPFPPGPTGRLRRADRRFVAPRIPFARDSFMGRLDAAISMRSEIIAEQKRLSGELAKIDELISIHENDVTEEFTKCRELRDPPAIKKSPPSSARAISASESCDAR